MASPRHLLDEGHGIARLLPPPGDRPTARRHGLFKELAHTLSAVAYFTPFPELCWTLPMKPAFARMLRQRYFI